MTTIYRVAANDVEIDDRDNFHDSLEKAREYFLQLYKYKNTVYSIIRKTKETVEILENNAC